MLVILTCCLCKKIFQSYPLICDLSRGLRAVRGTPYVTADDRYINAPAVQALRPQKFLLGRVISNEDICIQTETPFAFSIASTGNGICIAKVASADDLNGRQAARKISHEIKNRKQGPFITNGFSEDMLDDDENEDDGSEAVKNGIPVSLRLTFGSTPCMSTLKKSPSALSTYRSILHIDMLGCGREIRKPLVESNLFPSPFRSSLPCVTKLTSISPHYGTKPPLRYPENMTFFEQDI